jgi:predicted transcriptional regulator
LKTTKHHTLLLVEEKGSVRARDLVTGFNYSPATARSYLAYLTRQALLHRTSAGHSLTEKGRARLQFFEVVGCMNPDCPRCEGKAGHFTCRTCGSRLLKEKARLRPAWETLWFRKEAGVFCRWCQGQILNESQARLLGVAEG